MSDNETYMNDFFKVFERLKREGPGSKETTLSTLKLINNHQPFLDHTSTKATTLKLKDRVLWAGLQMIPKK